MAGSWFASAPEGDVAIPAAVARIAGDRPVLPVWENESGGLTFQLGSEFVKWAPRASGLDLRGEAARLRWAGAYTPVPRVLAEGEDPDGAWLVTAAMPGTSAVSERWKQQPAVAVRAIGTGLRALHDALPIAGCPFDWSVEERLRRARELGGGADLPPQPPIDRLVVCHGDPCAPNTLISDDGEWVGHVDLDQLGVADRWADLAVANWSTEWNYGPGWEDDLLRAYGIAADPVRTAYYRRLWDADA